MTLKGGNRITREKNLFSVLLCPPQIPHGLAWERTQYSGIFLTVHHSIDFFQATT